MCSEDLEKICIYSVAEVFFHFLEMTELPTTHQFHRFYKTMLQNITLF